MPDDHPAELLQTLADLRRQLAECRAERDEALAQQEAAAEVLQVINSSPGDLAPVFEAIVDKATRFCEAAYGHLLTYDGERLRRVAVRSVHDPRMAEGPQQAPVEREPGGPIDRLIRGESIVHLADVLEDYAYKSLPNFREFVDMAGVRTLLAVALRKDRTLLGIITIYRREVRPFSDKQIALLENFAAQAVIAMENARLITETREALEQQTATAEVLGVINSSPGDLAPVFDAMLEKAMRLCEAAFGVLDTYDGECFHPAAARGVPAAHAEFRVLNPMPPDPLTINGRIRDGMSLVHVADLMAEDAYRAGNAHRRALVDLGRARSAVAVALRKDDALLGVIMIYRQEVRPFSDKQIALLENFAAQAVIAMENARLITETREALEQQTATAEVLGVINASPGDLAPVFEAMLERALRLCDGRYGGLLRHDGELFHVMAAAHGDGQVAERAVHRPPIKAGLGNPLYPIVGGEPFVFCADVRESDPYRSDSHFREWVDSAGFRSLLNVALRKEGVLFGVIAIYRQEVRPFTDKQIALLQNFAAQAVIAMENARLLGETREALEQQTATAEVLGVINSSPGDLAPVFQAMLERALRLCGGAYGSLMRYDGELFHVAAAVHEDRGVLEAQRHRTPFPGSAGLVGPILRGENIVFVADVLQDDAYRTSEEFRQVVDSGGYRSILSVALRREGVLFGVIAVFRKESQPFTDKQIALLENFAAQAVIAMENARLITETREALEQQTATAEVLQVINSSPGDLAPVFDAMLERAMRLCDAAHGGLYGFDGELAHPLSVRGTQQYVTWVRQHTSFRLEAGDTPLRQVLGGVPVVHVADAQATEAYRLRERYQALVKVGDIRTTLIVALRKDETVLGAIAVFRQEVRPFTDKQIALLQNFAAQAVIAIENARLITETQEALEQQTATAEVLGVINSSPGDLAPVFDAMLEKAMRLSEAAFGTLRSYDGDRFATVAARGIPEAYASFLSDHQQFDASGAPMERIVEGEPMLHIEDAAAETNYTSPLWRALVELGGARTLLTVPLRKEGRLLGAITLYRTEVRLYSDKQIALLQNFAAQAVIAMENARLLTELRESLDRQTATADILRVIASTPDDPRRALDTIAETAVRMFNATNVVLRRIEDKGLRFVGGAGPTVAAIETLPNLRLDERDPATRAILEDRQVAIDDRQLSAATEGSEISHLHRAMHAGAVPGLAVRSQAFTPLSRQGNANGVMIVSRGEVCPFTSDELELMRGFADQAVIAIENARLLGELRERNDEIAGWNRELEERVAAQLAEIERTGKLRRFLAPQLAELIVAQGDDRILESHRREIVVVFCDLRGFTGFAERAEPEEVMALLRDYHAAMGPIVARFEGTIDHYGGDGIMVFFNDPLPTPDPARRAIDMAVAMREAAQGLLRLWRRQGHDIGFGVGIAQGYATLGQIGFAERMDYTAIGTVTNLAARLCAEARDGQILVSRRVAIAVEESLQLEEIGDLALKGLSQAVAVYNVPP